MKLNALYNIAGYVHITSFFAQFRFLPQINLNICNHEWSVLVLTVNVCPQKCFKHYSVLVGFSNFRLNHWDRSTYIPNRPFSYVSIYPGPNMKVAQVLFFSGYFGGYQIFVYTPDLSQDGWWVVQQKSSDKLQLSLVRNLASKTALCPCCLGGRVLLCPSCQSPASCGHLWAHVLEEGRYRFRF